MKTINSFAAQQLTKKQMNQVRGGAATFFCTCDIFGAKEGKNALWVKAVYASDYITHMINDNCAHGGTCNKMNI